MTRFFVNSNSGELLKAFDDTASPGSLDHLIPDGSVEVSEPPPSGRATWDGSQWIDTPPPVTSVSRRQGKQQLVIAGYWSQVQSAIDGIADETERLLTRIYFDDEESWGRNHPELLALADALGLTSEQLDELFREGANL